MPETVYTGTLGRGWYGLLQEVPGLLEALGPRADGPPIFPLVAPPGTPLPYLVWQVISNVSTHHLGGRSRLRRARVQVKAYALLPEQADALADAMRLALDDTLHGVQAAGLDVRSLKLLDEVPDYEQPTDGSEAGAFNVRQDWDLWYGAA